MERDQIGHATQTIRTDMDRWKYVAQVGLDGSGELRHIAAGGSRPMLSAFILIIRHSLPSAFD